MLTKSKILIQIKIEETVKISNKDLLIGVNSMLELKRFEFIEDLTKMDTVSKQKWNFVTSSRQLLKRDLSESEIFSMLGECNDLATKLRKKLNKFQVKKYN